MYEIATIETAIPTIATVPLAMSLKPTPFFERALVTNANVTPNAKIDKPAVRDHVGSGAFLSVNPAGSALNTRAVATIPSAIAGIMSAETKTSL